MEFMILYFRADGETASQDDDIAFYGLVWKRPWGDANLEYFNTAEALGCAIEMLKQ